MAKDLGEILGALENIKDDLKEWPFGPARSHKPGQPITYPPGVSNKDVFDDIEKAENYVRSAIERLEGKKL